MCNTITMIVIRNRLRRFILVAGAVICSYSLPALAEERQYKVEAAYLYSFFNYITWPGHESPQSLHEPMICVYGDDPIIPYLDYIRSKVAMERTLAVRTLNSDASLAGCHILFVRHRISARQLGAMAGTLVVFKPDDPLDRGGMIELSEEGERIVIKINQPLLEEKGFSVSSRLLDLTQRVR